MANDRHHRPRAGTTVNKRRATDFTPVGGPDFNVTLADVMDIKSLGTIFNGGVKFRICSEQFSGSFVDQHNEYTDIISGREAGKVWKKASGKI